MEENLKDYVITFGKHKGETLEQIYSSSDYLEWLVKQVDFFNKEAQEKARQYLKYLSDNGLEKNKEFHNDSLASLAREIVKRRNELKDKRQLINDPLKTGHWY